VTAVGGKEKKPLKSTVLGPYRFTHAQLEKEGIILESNVPDNRSVFYVPSSLRVNALLVCSVEAD
jgi:hypothetical protein